MALIISGRNERSSGGTRRWRRTQGPGRAARRRRRSSWRHPSDSAARSGRDTLEGSQDIPPADPEAVKNDMGLDGRIVIRRFDARGPDLTVMAFAGGPILQDPQAPDPAAQKTYLPEKPQTIPRGEDCVFWFSPYLQLTLRWDVQLVGGSKHVVLTGHWYRKTYARGPDAVKLL